MSWLSPIVLLIHVLGALGFVLVVSYSVIAKPVRERIWPKMLGCPQCFGVWGGFGWACLLAIRPALGRLAMVHDMLAFAFTISLLGYLCAAASSVGAAATKYTQKS